MGKHQNRTRLACVIGAVVTCAVLVQPGPTARASDFAPAVTPDLFAFSSSGPSVASTSAQDVNTAANALGLGFSTPPKIATLGAVVGATGLSATGDVVLASLSAGRWSVTDLSKLVRISAGTAVGAPMLDGAGSVHIVVTTAGGDLIDVSGPSPTSAVWTTIDISASATAPQSTGPASVLLDPSGAIDAFATTSAGELFEYVSNGGRNWTALDLTAVGGGPVLASAPVAIAAPIDGGLLSVFGRLRNGGVVRYCNDNVGFRLWSTTTLPVPSHQAMAGNLAVAATPTMTVVTGTTNAGHLATMSSTDGITWAVGDLSATAGVVHVPLVSGDPGITSSGASLLIAYRSTTSMLTELSSSGGPWQATNVSQLVNTGELVATSPAITAGPSGTVIVASDGGAVPVIGRIVTLAESQDQFHQKVVETPTDSNCNPYTAYWGRGSSHSDTSSAACAKGTASEEWCSDFAQWVWQKSGVDTTGINGWSFSFVDWGNAHGTFKRGAANNPKVGDALVWGNLAARRGDHVGIVVAVSGSMIDVVSGNSGPLDNGGFNVSVWRTGLFDPTKGDPSSAILGYISPLAPAGQVAHVVIPALSGAALTKAIASQDHRR